MKQRLNYLLVMPRLVQNIGDGYSFPLGITYISSSLKAAGFNVLTLNLNHRAGDVCRVLEQVILENEIDVVATGGLSFQYNMVRTVIEAAKKTRSDITTIVGGGIISGDPLPAMQALEYADIGVIGEGEITICELCRALENGDEIGNVDGIIFKRENSFVSTKPRKDIANIDALPWPDYEGFELEKYFAASPGISGLNRRNTVFMIASRSCPYNCTFCFHTTGSKYRQRSLDSFFQELEFMIKRYNIDFICLADELFSHSFERVQEFCHRISKFNIKWWAQFRVDQVTPELLEILKSAGCETMSFGLESADNRVLKSMRKGTTIEQIEKALKLVYEKGISLDGAFIFGDIEETWDTACNTLNWWKQHAEYKINLNLITVYPGSYLYKYACDRGIIKDRAQFLREGCPQINVSRLSEKEYARLIKSIMEAPMTLSKVLSVMEVDNIDYENGRIDYSGICTACRKDNRWEGVKLFAANFLACEQCGQRYNVVLPDVFKESIERNIESLLGQYEKIAIWGINYHTTNLIRNSKVLKGSNVFPVDISSTKRMMDLYGKRIFNPDVILEMGIEVVIVAIPVYYNEIFAKIKKRYDCVARVIDLCRLIDPQYLANNSSDNRSFSDPELPPVVSVGALEYQ